MSTKRKLLHWYFGRNIASKLRLSILIACFCHVSCLLKKNLHSILWMSWRSLLETGGRDIWNLTDRKEARTQSHLVRQRTLNHLAKLFGDSIPIAVTCWSWFILCLEGESCQCGWYYSNVENEVRQSGCNKERRWEKRLLIEWLLFRFIYSFIRSFEML